MIKIICCYFNYHHNNVRKNNYIRFRQKLITNDVCTIELGLNKTDFFIDDSIKIVVKTNQMVWQKERCFNLILESLPSKIDKVVWIDTDIILHNDNWIKDMEKKLDSFVYVQPFDRVIENHHIFNPQLNCNGYGRCIHDYIHYGCNMPPPGRIAEGLGWGIHTSILNNGFYDKHILRINDGLQNLAVSGDIFNHLLQKQSSYLIKSFLEYYRTMNHYDGSKIGYCEGTAEHLYHGSTQNRGYSDIEDIMQNYDPGVLSLSDNGLYELNDPILYENIQNYMIRQNIHTIK